MQHVVEKRCALELRVERLWQQWIGPRPLHLRRLEVVDVELQQDEVRRDAQRLREHVEVLRHVVARPSEVEDLVARPEVGFDQVREALRLVEPLAPRERIANDHDAVAIAVLQRHVAIAEVQVVGTDRGRRRRMLGHEVTGVAAGARVAEHGSRRELGRSQRRDRHDDLHRPAQEPRPHHRRALPLEAPRDGGRGGGGEKQQVEGDVVRRQERRVVLIAKNQQQAREHDDGLTEDGDRPGRSRPGRRAIRHERRASGGQPARGSPPGAPWSPAPARRRRRRGRPPARSASPRASCW